MDAVDALPIVFLYLFECMFLCLFLLIPFINPYSTRWKRALAFLACVLTIAGTTGFFGSAISASGGMNWLPSTFEWPIGRANGVVRTSTGLQVVPNEAGRIQIYDARSEFVRGWTVNVYDGLFTLRVSPEDNVEIFTARGSKHYVYSMNGELLSTSPSPGYPEELGETVYIPTAWWLWPFTSSFHSWLTAAIGIFMLVLIDYRVIFQLTRGARLTPIAPAAAALRHRLRTWFRAIDRHAP